MARKMQERGMIDTFGAGGGGQPFRGPPSSSLQGSRWGKGEPRPTEPPMSKMELRAKQRQASQPPADEGARAARKAKFGINFKKGGMVEAEERGEPKRSAKAERREEAREHSGREYGK